MALVSPAGLLVIIATLLQLAAATAPKSGPTGCKKTEFWYQESNCCLPSGGPPNPPKPPKDSDCPPTSHYWGEAQGCCVPRNPLSPNNPLPQCRNGWEWVANLRKCVPEPTPSPGPTSCKKTEFWYKESSCCVPRGGPPNPPKPPTDSDCPPSTYYWGEKQGCCIPRNPPPPNSPSPQCKTGWVWVPALRKCVPKPTKPTPTPTPSPKPTHHDGGYGSGNGQAGGGYGGGSGASHGNGQNHVGYGGHWKRARKSRSVSLCPAGLDACLIGGLGSSDYECIDVMTDLESCGGCASTGRGQNCTAISGARNAGCEAGRCVVYKCLEGYRLSVDGKSCIPL